MNISYNLIYGYEYITEGKIKTVHDFYMGIGVRNTSFDTYILDESYANTTNNYITIYTKTSQKSKAFAPSLIIGYAFGFAFN